MKRFLFSLLSLFTVLGHAEVYQIILDGEDTAYSVRSGNWTLDKTQNNGASSYLGNYRFAVAGPGTGASVCCWTIDSIPAGTYNVEFYVDNANYAAAAEYVVEHDGGVTTLTASQNFVGTGWRPLGTFAFKNAGRILQTDKWAGAGTMAIADALRLTLHGEPQPHSGNVVSPTITVVIDDLGALNPATPSSFTAQLFAGAPNYTYAIIPSLAFSTAVLQDAHNKGIETILHQPLQYIGQPDVPSPTTGDATRLYIGHSDSTILSRIQTNLDSMIRVPGTPPTYYIVGANNHQGSRFSQYAQGLHVALNEVKSRNLFWYDSRTISDSLSYRLAKEKGMLVAQRDLFLDGTSSQDTKNKILSVARRAKFAPTYEHLLIGHQGANTVPALVEVLNDLQTTGVGLRRLSRNVHYIVETDMQPPGASVQYTGSWAPHEADMISHDCYDGNAMRHVSNQAGSARFIPNMPMAGSYRVFIGFGGSASNDNAQVKIHGVGPDFTAAVDQVTSPNRWHFIGLHDFAVGTGGYVEVSTDAAGTAATEHVFADSVKFVYDGPSISQVSGWDKY